MSLPVFPPARSGHAPFLRWLLANVVFLAVVAVAAHHLSGMHEAARVSAGAILTVFVLASAHAGACAYQGRRSRHLPLAIIACPALGLIGAASGFYTALQADVSDVQTAVLGASSSLVATMTGVACMVALEVIGHLADA